MIFLYTLEKALRLKKLVENPFGFLADFPLFQLIHMVFTTHPNYYYLWNYCLNLNLNQQFSFDWVFKMKINRKLQKFKYLYFKYFLGRFILWSVGGPWARVWSQDFWRFKHANSTSWHLLDEHLCRYRRSGDSIQPGWKIWQCY